MDGVGYDTVAARLVVYLNRDGEYRRQQRRHNRTIIDVALKLESDGVAVYAGYRNLVNIPGITQIAPDAVLCLTRNDGRTLLVNVELELTARAWADATEAQAISAGGFAFPRACAVVVGLRGSLGGTALRRTGRVSDDDDDLRAGRVAHRLFVRARQRMRALRKARDARRAGARNGR